MPSSLQQRTRQPRAAPRSTRTVMTSPRFYRPGPSPSTRTLRQWRCTHKDEAKTYTLGRAAGENDARSGLTGLRCQRLAGSRASWARGGMEHGIGSFVSKCLSHRPRGSSLPHQLIHASFGWPMLGPAVPHRACSSHLAWIS